MTRQLASSSEPSIRIKARPLVESLVPTPDAVAELHELRQDIDRLLSTLPPKEVAVIRGYFGLDACGGSTLDELGKQFGVCRERIRQIRDKALRKLRHPIRRTQLAAYVDIHGADEYARFVESENAAERAAREAEHVAREARWAAERAAREASLKANAAKREALRVKQEQQRIKAEEKQLARFLQHVGEPVKDLKLDRDARDRLKRSIANMLCRISSKASCRVRTEDQLIAYFTALSQHRDLFLALYTWKRDVRSIDSSFTFTRAIAWDGSFMIYAKHGRNTWYLCDMPDGLRWVGFISEVP